MKESEARGVEVQAIRLGTAVEGITDDCVADGREVRADLVAPAGFDKNTQ